MKILKKDRTLAREIAKVIADKQTDITWQGISVSLNKKQRRVIKCLYAFAFVFFID